MRKLLTTGVALFITSQANAAIYGIFYTFERDARASGDLYYMYSKPLTTAKPDPLHLLNSPPSLVNHPGGAEPVYGYGYINTVTGDIVLHGIDFEIAIPSGSIGYFGYTQTLHGYFDGYTYHQTSNSASWIDYVCEVGSEVSSPCKGGALDQGRVDPDGIAFGALRSGGSALFFQKDPVFPFVETRIEISLMPAMDGGGEPDIEFIITPIPAAAWLFGSALLGLAGIGRKRDKVLQHL